MAHSGALGFGAPAPPATTFTRLSWGGCRDSKPDHYPGYVLLPEPGPAPAAAVRAPGAPPRAVARGNHRPDLSITISQFVSPHGGRMVTRSDAYEEAKAYIGASSRSRRARHLRAEVPRNAAADKILLNMVDHEEVADEFQFGQGATATIWWSAYTKQKNNLGDYETGYKLHFEERHRDIVLDTYLQHVRSEGRAIIVKGRQRKIFTNTSDHDGWANHVPFDHPKTFDTLAMDPARKQEIMDDLRAFKDGKEYYAHLGKPWKRGYLLYGPPGTGKSSMIAAIANFLEYDVYDIELTMVRSNTQLRQLLIGIKNKSVIVIEDIDCSLDLTGARDKTKPAEDDENDDGASTSAAAAAVSAEEINMCTNGSSRMTLSGLLNFIDGLWSACGEERIIVFTTNHVEKLDPALIRKGRMDKHIKMSYCGFEAFKSLAKLYLDVESHELFGTIEVEELLGEVKMTPVNVAEKLTRKGKRKYDDAGFFLADLVTELETIKRAKGIA